MFPILFRWHSFVLHTYGLFVALGFLAGTYWTVRLGKRRGIPADAVLDITWACLLGGLAGARLLYVAFHGDYYLHAPLEIFKIWQGGVVWYGGFLGGGAAGFFWLHWKKSAPVGLMADLAAPGVALGHALGRLGCFSAGCCYGKIWNGPLAVRFTNPETLAPPGIPLYPSQLFEAGLNLVLFLLLNFLAVREKPSPGTGKLAALYVALYSVIRFFVEFTRGDDRGPVLLTLSSTQWLAVLAFVATLAWFILSFPQKRESRP